jgi:hypothetical protein
MDLLYLWELAESSLRGIKVRASDVERLRAKLYQARAETDRFAGLSLIPDPSDPTVLWIVKKEQPNGP